MKDLDVQSAEAAAGHRGRMKAIRIPFVAWGISLAIHLLLLVLIMNLFWAGGKGAGTEGREYEVGIAMGAGSDAVTTDMGARGSTQLQDAPAVEEMAFETNFEADVELQNLSSEMAVDASSTDTASLESLATGQAAMGQGMWADIQLAGGGKGQGGASFFGLEAKGGKFVFVVDRSGSMSGQPLIAAKNELTRSILNLDSGMEFFVFFYNTDPLGMPGGKLVKASKSHISDALEWIDRVSATGGTDPLSTMQHALSLKPDAIWLLSDGQFAPDLVEKIRHENPGGRVVIHTISFFNRAGEDVLKKIAAQNGGKFRFVQ